MKTVVESMDCIVAEDGRKVTVWRLSWRGLIERARARKLDAHSLGWEMLSHRRSMARARRTDSGDCQRNNWGLNVLENALDWSLGLSAVRKMFALVEARKCPKSGALNVYADRSGNVWTLCAPVDSAGVQTSAALAE